MFGSDFFSAPAHSLGVPSGGASALPGLDPTVSSLEQLQVSGSGWLPAPASGASAHTVYVDPTAAGGGDGSLAKPYNSWFDVSWQAGTTYLQKGNTVSTDWLFVGGSGTAQAPIVIGSYGGGPAMINGSISIQNASYVAVTGFYVFGSGFAGAYIADGSSHVELAGNAFANSYNGVQIGDNAGGGDLIAGNYMIGNAWFGIGVMGVNNAVGSESVVIGNIIYNNGCHGIELGGNRFVIENNFVDENGGGMSGSSGIHAFAADATQDAGNYNTIRYNLVMNTHESYGQDGNGIELDQFTHDNQVYGNLTYNNDGAGIAIFNSSNDTVQNNTMIGDALDSGGAHSVHAELVVMTSGNPTIGETIQNNTALALTANSEAIFVNSATALNNPLISNNVFANFGGGNVYFWAGHTGTDINVWNAYPKGSGVDSFTLVT